MGRPGCGWGTGGGGYDGPAEVQLSPYMFAAGNPNLVHFPRLATVDVDGVYGIGGYTVPGWIFDSPQIIAGSTPQYIATTVRIPNGIDFTQGPTVHLWWTAGGAVNGTVGWAVEMTTHTIGTALTSSGFFTGMADVENAFGGVMRYQSAAINLLSFAPDAYRPNYTLKIAIHRQSGPDTLPSLAYLWGCRVDFPR